MENSSAPPLPQQADARLLLHNPRCSKSRAALALLKERGVKFAVREYLKRPLTPAELKELAKRLRRPIHEWTRAKEARELGLAPAQMDQAQLHKALAENPALMERPVFLCGARAVIGRPPEDVLQLL